MRDFYMEALLAVEAKQRIGELRVRPHDAVEAIAQAGLLLNPPKPNVFPDGAVEWPTFSGYVHHHDGLITVWYDDRDEDEWPEQLEPAEDILKIRDAGDARVLALCLLAAAEYLEAE